MIKWMRQNIELIPVLVLSLILTRTLYIIHFTRSEEIISWDKTHTVEAHFVWEFSHSLAAILIISCLVSFFVNKLVYSIVLLATAILTLTMQANFLVGKLSINGVVDILGLCLLISVVALYGKQISRQLIPTNRTTESELNKSEQNRLLIKFSKYPDEKLIEISNDQNRTEEARSAAKYLLKASTANNG